MCGKSGKTSKIAAAIVILFNIVTLIFCILIFSISLWIIVSPKTLSSIIQSLGNSTIKMMIPLESLTLQLGIVGAFISAFFFFISAMGIYGTISGSQFLLFMYATLVILLLLLECAVMFYVSSNAIEKGLQEHSVISHSIRISLKCCDVNDSKPQEQLLWSCCNVTAYENCTREVAYTMDCQQKLIKWLSKYETAIYVTLAVVHIILSSCSVLRRSYSASHSHS